MTRKELHPFGEERPDTVAQSIRDKQWAELCKVILERMTGEECEIIPRANGHYYVMRDIGDKWVRA
jgi:hypothetical protein